jgi:hypothetical protein
MAGSVDGCPGWAGQGCDDHDRETAEQSPHCRVRCPPADCAHVAAFSWGGDRHIRRRFPPRWSPFTGKRHRARRGRVWTARGARSVVAPSLLWARHETGRPTVPTRPARGPLWTTRSPHKRSWVPGSTVIAGAPPAPLLTVRRFGRRRPVTVSRSAVTDESTHHHRERGPSTDDVLLGKHDEGLAERSFGQADDRRNGSVTDRTDRRPTTDDRRPAGVGPAERAGRE